MIKYFTQTIVSFVLLLSLTAFNAWADVANSADAIFSQGLSCLKSSDIACAKIAQSQLNSQSKLAKILDGAIAVSENNADLCLRLLLPLKSDTTLASQAHSSLHVSLALAYEMLDDPLRALEHRIISAQRLTSPDEIDSAQQLLWNFLSSLDKARLIELRGSDEAISDLNIDYSIIQGWIDLAISAKEEQSLESWTKNYPDHPASKALLAKIANTMTQTDNKQAKDFTGLNGKIALLLPFNVTDFYPVSDAIERGFSAAKSKNKDGSEIQIYPTSGNKDEVIKLYQQAIKEGARYVVGPLTRDEASAISATANPELPVITLMLNQPETNASARNLHTFSLSVDAEAAQLATIGRTNHLQSALVISSDSLVAMRMSKVFYEAWQAEGGNIAGKINLKKESTPEEIKAQLANLPASDIIIFACNTELARLARPFLNISTPTFGFSHLYAGVNFDTLDQALNAVHFIDMPWLLAPQTKEFADYQAIAAELPQGQMQRWFALGVDAYQVLYALSTAQSRAMTLRGLTGKINISEQGEVSRELAQGLFSSQGVTLEMMP